MKRRSRKRGLFGPARNYRRSPARYEAVRHKSMHGEHVRAATRLGCRDAVLGAKNPYKPEASGFVAAYREGYRICEAINSGRDRYLTRDEKHTMRRLHLESEVQFTPLDRRRRRLP